MKVECVDTELSLLYGLFKYGKDAVKVFDASPAKEEHFANLTNREISQIMCERLRKGDSLSMGGFLTYYKNMQDRPDKEVLKVLESLRELKTHQCTLEDFKVHCISITEFACRRKFLGALNNSIDYVDRDFDGTITNLEKTFSELRRMKNPKQVQTVMGLKTSLRDRQALAKDIHDNPDKVGMCELGFKNIDKYIGRQAPGEFVLYQARTNTGKSMFLMHTALHNYKRGLKGIIITIEMSASQYLYRMDSNITGLEHKQFSSGSITTDSDLMKRWDNKISCVSTRDEDLLVYWVPSGCTPAKVRSILANNPFDADFVIIDYAGDMKSGIAGVSDYDAASFGVIYSSLKEFAGEFNCVVYSAQQTKRGVKKVDTESGSWSDIASHKADVMIALEITKEDEDFMTEFEGVIYNGRMSISIIKGRNIPKCKTQVIPQFHKMTFIEKEQEEIMAVGFSSIKTKKKKVQESGEQVSKTDVAVSKEDKKIKNSDDEEIFLLD